MVSILGFRKIIKECFADVCFKCGRVSMSERIFVHKNLLISLAFGHTVYILDINIFPSRKVHHVSTENRQ